jgi:hypothetical protein
VRIVRVLIVRVGAGALVINTHRLNSINFDSARTLSDGHRGGVVTVGAGVMFKDLYAKAWPRNLDVLGGECPVSVDGPSCHPCAYKANMSSRLLGLRAASTAVVDKVPCLATTELVRQHPETRTPLQFVRLTNPRVRSCRLL